MNEEDIKKAIQLVILPRATITDQPDQDEQPPPPPPPPPPPSDEQQEEEEDQEEEEQENEEQEEQEQEVADSQLLRCKCVCDLALRYCLNSFWLAAYEGIYQ